MKEFANQKERGGGGDNERICIWHLKYKNSSSQEVGQNLIKQARYIFHSGLWVLPHGTGMIRYV